MKFDFVLSQEQQALAESNLAVIDKVISRCIHANEGICGLGRDDLYQEGAAALCKARPPTMGHPPSSAPTPPL